MMEMDFSNRPVFPSAQRWALAAAAFAAGLGLYAVISDALGEVRALHWLQSGTAAMAPSTALSFLVAGGLLTAKLAGVLTGKGLAVANRVAAGFVAAVALANIAIIAAGTGTGIDDVLLPSALSDGVELMSPATSVSFILAAVLLDRRPRDQADPRLMPFVVIATAGLLLSLFVIVTYAFDAEALYAMTAFSGMALPTATGFVALFSAFLLTRPTLGWVGVLGGHERGSRGARRLVPLVVLLPLVLCLITLELTKAGVLTPNFRLSMLAVLIMAILGAAVIYNAEHENVAERELQRLASDLNQSVEERDLLLRELYHRIKNNLQQVNGLIGIEAARIDDPAVSAAFESVRHRVHALGAVYRILAAPMMPTEISAGQFLTEISDHLAPMHGGNVKITIDAAPVEMTLDVAVPVGLVVNEVITNAMKHAFPDGRSGKIQIRYEETGDGGALLVVTDDGIGMDAAFSPADSGGSGMKILRALVGQLQAKFETDTPEGGGTRVTVAIPAEVMTRNRKSSDATRSRHAAGR